MTETELTARLTRLERGNRRMKSFALAALILAVALVTIYAKYPTGFVPDVPNVIKAHAFDVVDTAGVTRVSVSGSGSIVLYDERGDPQLQISDFGQDGPRVMLGFHPVSRANTAFFRSDVVIGDSASGRPSIVLSDSRGFAMDLGGAGTVTERTGETQQTSADSIVMFGNDRKHRVIWQAP